MNIKNRLNELKSKKNSLNIKTLIYLILFSLAIVLFLWIFEILFLEFSYEHYQMKKIKNIIPIIEEKESGELDNLLLNIAYENSICITYEDFFGIIKSYNTKQVGCGLDHNIKNINEIKNNLKNNENLVNGIKLINPQSKTKAYLYSIKKDYGYIFLYSTLENLDSTSIVLKSQLIYIMFIVLLFSCLIAYFLSKKITKPITEITKKAREMGKGNYDVVFHGNGTLEIDELSNTLNNACLDISKIDKLRRDLLANVSHDLKTPLTMIKAYAEMVRDISYKDKEKRQKDLNIIIDETDRLTILVNDLLELSKLENKQNNLCIEKYNLKEEIDLIISKYDIIKELENYKFIVDVPENTFVLADKNKMNQVIYNLLNNAINYTGKDKKVTIKVTDQKEFYLVEIIDTGSGIKESDMPYIWDRYYKNDKNHQRNVVGSGIGLSIVRNILEVHNFKYGVKSKKNKGAIFYFQIRKNVSPKLHS